MQSLPRVLTVCCVHVQGFQQSGCWWNNQTTGTRFSSCVRDQFEIQQQKTTARQAWAQHAAEGKPEKCGHVSQQNLMLARLPMNALCKEGVKGYIV